MKSIKLPPYAPTLIESTRAMGYSLEAAVADIIDNSIAANADKIDIFFFPVDGEYIAFLDNGDGMSDTEIDIAMQYGSKSPLETRRLQDLGRFGLGLKTASLSQCKVLTVISKHENIYCARRWDVDFVSQTSDWSLLILEDDELESCPHFQDLKQQDKGTLVIWQNLDRLKAGELDFEQALSQKMDIVKEHISLVFHRYLAGEDNLKKLQIRLNMQKVEPTDPFLTAKSNQAMDDEIIILHGEKMTVRPYILPHTSKMTAEELAKLGGKEGLRRRQGFYVYRNKRLLIGGTWFKMMRQGELSKLVRIRVDIPNSLDDLWTLDIKKSSAMPPAEVRMNLKAVIEKMALKSKRTWTVRGKREHDESQLHLWERLRTRNGGYIYDINKEHPIVAHLYSTYPAATRSIDLVLRHIATELPLNSLYLDLTNDEKLENDNMTSRKQIFETVEALLQGLDKGQRDSMIKALVLSAPFSEYSQEITERFLEGE